MKKYFVILAILLFSFQSTNINSIVRTTNNTSFQPQPAGQLPAKNETTCKNMWAIDSKGKDSVSFVVGGFVGISKYNKNGYIKACKEGALPSVKPIN